MHWVPCMVDYDGPARVDEFFRVKVSDLPHEADKGIYHASLRGRHLAGIRRQLPDGFVGAVLEVAPDCPPDTPQYTCRSTFRHLHIFNHDVAPSSSDLTTRCLDWMALSSQMHAPVPLEHVEEKLRMLKKRRMEE